MSKDPYDKSFIFDIPFNSHYLNELYDGDYIMIEETFTDVLKEYDPLLQQVYSCYRSDNIPALKSAVHKIKPLLGYTGMTDLQSQCLEFENACQQGRFPSLDADFASLSANLSGAKALIEKEKERLSQYIQNLG